MSKKKNSLWKGSSLRILILTAVCVILAAILIQRLFVLQIIRGESYLNNFAVKIKKTRTLSSPRGQIYDCNGELLAYNELSYVVTFEDVGDYNNRHEGNLIRNSILYNSAKMIESISEAAPSADGCGALMDVRA